MLEHLRLFFLSHYNILGIVIFTFIVLFYTLKIKNINKNLKSLMKMTYNISIFKVFYSNFGYLNIIIL